MSFKCTTTCGYCHKEKIVKFIMEDCYKKRGNYIATIDFYIKNFYHTCFSILLFYYFKNGHSRKKS